KLESIGQLAAGIAHEINTPAQYVGDNLRFLLEAFSELTKYHDEARSILQRLALQSNDRSMAESMKTAADPDELEYLGQEIPRAIQQSLEGIVRITGIVKAMREFSHPGNDEKSNLDLNKAIDSTITVARNEWKYFAEMVTELDPLLPLVPCLPGEFNQVILNLIINAAQAISEKQNKSGNRQKGTITVSTRLFDSNTVEIRIADTGTGIPKAIRSRIFDPFFTTKEVGKGTGQGLAISRSVIVDKHGGTIDLESQVG
ncbi:MAG: ATP-binding protein, partial [Syntrophobacteraceae bacterium]